MPAQTQAPRPAEPGVDRVLERHYEPNRRLAADHGLTGYNCGFADVRGAGSFADHQRALVFRLLGDTPICLGDVVLDVGCGIGGPARWIAQRFTPLRVIGLEYCWASVRAAKAGPSDDAPGNGATSLPGASIHAPEPALDARTPRFLRGDAQRIPLADASVTVIFNLESALHYPDKDAFLAECARVLRPGGRLCLGDITLGRRFMALPMRLSNYLPSQDNSYSHLWDRRRYLAAFHTVGFRVLRDDDVTAGVAAALADGLSEIRRRGFRASRGYRRRILYMGMIRWLFITRALRYNLFTLERQPD